MKHAMHRAIDAWPDDVELALVGVHGGLPAANPQCRMTSAEQVVLRAARWRPVSAGWWVLDEVPETPVDAPNRPPEDPVS